VIRRILAAILTVIAFNMTAMGVMIALSPGAGLAWVLLLTAAFYAWSVRPGRRRLRRLARLRVRRPDAAPRWIALACAATLALMAGTSSVIGLIAPDIDAADIPEWYILLQPYRESAAGWAALTVLVAFTIPMVEEFCFRGHVQRTLERRLGIAWAITLSAALFMALHVGGPHWSILGISLTLGVACGLAVHTFRSIWPAVLLHCIWNGGMLLADMAGPYLDAGAAPGTAGLVAGAALGLGAGTAGWRLVLRRRDLAPMLRFRPGPTKPAVRRNVMER
jgi:membrane protease YdiL (CAAX protease family)